jgi:hypothetical protein
MTFELFTTRRIRNRPFLRNIVQECMPDCKEKLATNVPFTIVIREFVTYGQPQFLGKFLKVWLLVLQVIHFG